MSRHGNTRGSAKTATTTPPTGGRKEHDMSQKGARGMKVTFTEEQIEHAATVARGIAARADSYADRFASPHERRDVGQRLNPSTAHVFFIYGEVLDPYGELDLQPEESCIGRMWFAVDPVERIAVSFYDLPEETCVLLDPKQREADADGWRTVLAWRDE